MTDPTQPNTNSDHDEYDPEMEDDGMTEMVNVSDESIIVRIASGKRVQKTKLKPGGSGRFPEGYCCDVKGAGRHVLPSIITRQSLRADKVPRVVQKKRANQAREYFEDRVYGTADANNSEVQDLKEKLAIAEARAEIIAKRAGGKSDALTESVLSRMNKQKLMAIAGPMGISDEGTKAQIIAEILENATE